MMREISSMFAFIYLALFHAVILVLSLYLLCAAAAKKMRYEVRFLIGFVIASLAGVVSSLLLYFWG